MKKILFVLIAFSIATITFASEEENAAFYYNKAFELLKLPELGSELFREVIEVVENGLKTKNKELEDILTVNEPAFKEFYKGLALDKCDFSYISPYDNPFAKPIPNMLHVRNMSNLLVLKARILEYENNFDEAVSMYFDLMQFSRHISQGDSLVEVMIAIALDTMVYGPLNQYLGQPDVKKDTCYKILKSFNKVEPEMVTPKEAIMLEKKQALLLFEYLVDESINKYHQETDDGKISARRFEELKNYYKQKFLPRAKILANKYYDMLITATEGNFAAGWNHFDKELTLLRESVADECDVEDTDIASYFFTKTEDFNNKMTLKWLFAKDKEDRFADITARTMLAILLPNIARAPQNMYVVMTMFRIIKTAAAVKLYYLKTGIAPETLNDLIPIYLKEVPRDPYSHHGLKYKKEGNSFIIYGAGKDRVDNGGAGKFLTNSDEGEDIVLQGGFSAD